MLDFFKKKKKSHLGGGGRCKWAILVQDLIIGGFVDFHYYGIGLKVGAF